MHRPNAIHCPRLRFDAVAGVLMSLLLACSLETGGAGPAGSDLGSGPDDPAIVDPNGNDPTDLADAGRGISPPVLGDGAVVAPATTTGSCSAGHYEGSYDCTYKQQGPFGLSSSTVTGAVSFDLAQKSSGDTFDVVAGTFAANPAAFQTIAGTMSGTLKCGRPFEGKLLKGMASGLFQLGSTTFTASLLATYDTKLTTFVQGTWSIPADGSNAGCDGSWNAHLLKSP
ncbi:MAG: hypothetical protein JWN04_366 [Myxococcaceae bacterium]|nr:hypothetical protein [Myxococcaceae bacterium]